MYQVCVRKNFIASHFLIGGNWGLENHLHSHDYCLEVLVEGAALNHHGYLVDIDDLKTKINDSLAPYIEKVLNESPDFQNLNPSLEHFAAILARKIASSPIPGVTSLKVRLWEDQSAYASFKMPLLS